LRVFIVKARDRCVILCFHSVPFVICTHRIEY
jgi:hypothetical protein